MTKAFLNHKFFVTRYGNVAPYVLIYDYNVEINPQITSKDFIPNLQYLMDLLYSEIYFTFILDEINFYNFISDIQTITSLNLEQKIKKEWNKKRREKRINDSFIFCIYSPKKNIRNKLMSEEENLLNRNHLKSIKIEVINPPDDIKNPEEAVKYFIRTLMRNFIKNEIKKGRGYLLSRPNPFISL